MKPGAIAGQTHTQGLKIIEQTKLPFVSPLKRLDIDIVFG